MSSLPSVDDLRLVLTIGPTSSVGAAARELRISQPSASQRLARLERPIGVRLVARHTPGARATAAGTAHPEHDRHLRGHLEGWYGATRAAAAAERLDIGTCSSLAASLFPALEELLPDIAIQQHADHGDQLIPLVAEGTMDAAFVAYADQVMLPRGTSYHPVGHDELVLFLPAGVREPKGTKEPFKDRRVVFTTYDLRSEEVRTRLIGLGAEVRRGATLATTLAMARRRGEPAVVPRSAVTTGLPPGERVEPAPFRIRLTLSAVTGATPPRAILAVLPALRRELALTPTRR